MIAQSPTHVPSEMMDMFQLPRSPVLIIGCLESIEEREVTALFLFDAWMRKPWKDRWKKRYTVVGKKIVLGDKDTKRRSGLDNYQQPEVRNRGV